MSAVPRVSVIIPAHNAAPYLDQTLASVSAQTFDDWEVVAVDDGSVDATWEMLQQAGPRVTALRNPAANGPAAARNRALDRATGELVVFLDADDMLRPRYLESQIACLDAALRDGRRVGLVTCDALILDEDGYAPHTYLDMVRDRNRPLTLDLVLARNPIYISSLVPVAVGEAVGWFDPELFGTEDFGLWLKILEQGFEAVRNPEALGVYRRQRGTVSSDIARQGVNNRRAYELALARGSLTPRQRRIAKRALRYNGAMEAVARLRFASAAQGARPSPLEIARLAPLLAWVVLTNPRWWAQWITILRTGRQPAVGTRRATGDDVR